MLVEIKTTTMFCNEKMEENRRKSLCFIQTAEFGLNLLLCPAGKQKPGGRPPAPARYIVNKMLPLLTRLTLNIGSTAGFMLLLNYGLHPALTDMHCTQLDATIARSSKSVLQSPLISPVIPSGQSVSMVVSVGSSRAAWAQVL